jgi:hypothetical protein
MRQNGRSIFYASEDGSITLQLVLYLVVSSQLPTSHILPARRAAALKDMLRSLKNEK